MRRPRAQRPVVTQIIRACELARNPHQENIYNEIAIDYVDRENERERCT
jgi:hypothetical protein